MKFLIVLLVICAVAYAEPPRFGRRFNSRAFARQEEAPQNGNGYNYPQPEKPANGGYSYPTPEYGLPDPDSQPPPAQPAPEEEPTTDNPEDLEETTEVTDEVETETDETPIEEVQAEQFRRANLRKLGKKGRPLKLVQARTKPAQLQRLVYYPVQSFARLEQAIPVQVAVPQQGFAYSTQVFQQNW